MSGKGEAFSRRPGRSMVVRGRELGEWAAGLCDKGHSGLQEQGAHCRQKPELSWLASRLSTE